MLLFIWTVAIAVNFVKSIKLKYDERGTTTNEKVKKPPRETLMTFNE